MSSEAASRSAGHGAGFIKTLSGWDVFFLGFGSMIGFGWIVLSGGWITDAGPLGAGLAFLVGGAIMAIIMMTGLGFLLGSFLIAGAMSLRKHKYKTGFGLAACIVAIVGGTLLLLTSLVLLSRGPTARNMYGDERFNDGFLVGLLFLGLGGLTLYASIRGLLVPSKPT